MSFDDFLFKIASCSKDGQSKAYGELQRLFRHNEDKMITSDIQQIEKLIEQLRRPWEHGTPQNDVLTDLKELCLSLANDIAKARELCRASWIKINQQDNVLKAITVRCEMLDRRINTAFQICDLPADEQTKITAIREVLKGE